MGGMRGSIGQAKWSEQCWSEAQSSPVPFPSNRKSSSTQSRSASPLSSDSRWETGAKHWGTLILLLLLLLLLLKIYFIRCEIFISSSPSPLRILLLLMLHRFLRFSFLLHIPLLRFLIVFLIFVTASVDRACSGGWVCTRTLIWARIQTTCDFCLFELETGCSVDVVPKVMHVSLK